MLARSWWWLRCTGEGWALLLPSTCPGSSQNAGVRLWDRSQPHPQPPGASMSLTEPRGHGDGHHGALRTWVLPCPNKRRAKSAGAQHGCPDASPASPLLRCPQAPPPCGARPGWPLCSPTVTRAHRGAVWSWRQGEALPPLIPVPAPDCSLTQPCREWTVGVNKVVEMTAQPGLPWAADVPQPPPDSGGAGAARGAH